ncbi:aldehyde dehydrogenase family protein, partial [Clostridioides difficile]|nr:aldehyde dehydrogenase family protein [Clostridioides difficile]
MEIKNYIGGKWITHSHLQSIAVTNPANGEQLATIPRSTSNEVGEAVAVAKQAQKSWALIPAPKRADYLYAIGQKMKEKKEHLATVLTKEMGKVIEEARGEVQEGIDMAYYMAGEGRRLFGETTPSELANKFAMSVRAPIGVVALITPWNFPVAIATWKSFPA